MPKYYLLDENKNLVEGFDKEGFLALLEQAIEDGSLEHIDENSAVASKIKSLLNGTTHNIEFVTQAQYNQLVADEELVPNTYYFITDDTTLEGLEESLNQFSNRLTSAESSIQNIINGTQVVGNATNATNASNTDFTNAGFVYNLPYAITETGFYYFAWNINQDISTDKEYWGFGLLFIDINKKCSLSYVHRHSDGTTTDVYELVYTPSPKSVKIYKNGVVTDKVGIYTKRIR